MAKYGKKNTISTDLSKLIFGLLGESGVGKTTTLYLMAEKLFGDEGYLVLDMGSEYGTEYIEGINAEQTETFKKFLDVTNDIIKNKDTDYPKLKVIIVDTLDALFEIGEPYLIKLYNQENLGAKNFVPVKTINAVEGGFMHGQDRLIEIVVDQIVKLRRAGIGVWYTGHVKRRSTDDVFSGDSYDQLTTNMSQRYFSAIKNKTHALGIAYIDRTLAQQEVGKENPITHKKNTITKIMSESRKVKFRDDSYTADSKSRLEHIVDEVNLDEDEIIKALKDAIAKGKKSADVIEENPVNIKLEEDPEIQAMEEQIETIDEAPFDIDDEIEDTIDEEDVEEDPIITLDNSLLSAIRAAYKDADTDVKAEIKVYLANYNGKLSAEMKESDVKAIKKILGV